MWQQARRSGAPQAAGAQVAGLGAMTDHACLTDALHPADRTLLRLRGPQRPGGRAVRRRGLGQARPCGAMRPTQIAQRPRPTQRCSALGDQSGRARRKHCEGPDRRGPAQAARSAATSTTGGVRQELSDRFVTAARAALAWYDDGMVRRDDAGGKPVGVTLFLSSGCES